MKTKYTSKLLIGAATLSLATLISQGTANASEQTSSLADAQPVSYESTNVSPEQKAFYQVLHMEDISESQRDQYIKKLHENPESAQNVFSESIKDAKNPERRVAQQNAFYSVLHNEDLSEQQRDAYISEIREDADQSQEVFVKSLNSTPEAEQPQTPHNDLLEKEHQNLLAANEALKALTKEDTIQNRRAAQHAVNKLPRHKVDAFQKELDKINAPRDAKIKADAEAKRQGLQIGESPNIEKTPVPIEDTPQVEKKEDHKAESDSKVKEAPKADTEKKADAEKKPQAENNAKAEKAPKVEAPKVQTPKVENKTETDKTAETKKAEEAKPSTEATPEVKNNADNGTVAPVLPETGEATTSTLSSYWNAFKDGVYNGYTYLKDGVTKGLDYLKEQYKYVTKKYNDAKYYTKLYKNHKSLIDTTVLGVLNKNGTRAHIAPIKIEESFNPFYKSYAQTRNFVTEGINTGKVLYTLYQNPSVVKGAIAAAEAIDTAKNAFSSILSFFK
ncbi:B domain-containing protein [Staphylococcus delphini]|uniref:B domain-containing protein n=1 Tax=Staphylococcus delphini TaxID=53344 RepID=UPI000BBC069C|nr:B domain-containing protein [Staphylococcus delphini]PCF41360.1 IgG-binding protein SBI [Staphylococcus delphini]PCF52494.1 IgG-binding protein SBI [Staphylococcus delphini]PCF57506.1 IgG-binding protein SBI [Staphylococcus delphini]PCF59532.1 IgG-binding protein SBI [Staphylococcus delphini]